VLSRRGDGTLDIAMANPAATARAPTLPRL
jgi:hypothetical protein